MLDEQPAETGERTFTFRINPVYYGKKVARRDLHGIQDKLWAPHNRASLGFAVSVARRQSLRVLEVVFRDMAEDHEAHEQAVAAYDEVWKNYDTEMRKKRG